MKHAYVRCETDGTICVRRWVDCPTGVSRQCLVRVRPGETALGVPYDVWHAHAGCFVDVDDLRRQTSDVKRQQRPRNAADS